MKRPSKKDIKAKLDQLKGGAANDGSLPAKEHGGSNNAPALSEKKSSQRIRKQGV